MIFYNSLRKSLSIYSICFSICRVHFKLIPLILSLSINLLLNMNYPLLLWFQRHDSMLITSWCPMLNSYNMMPISFSYTSSLCFIIYLLFFLFYLLMCFSIFHIFLSDLFHFSFGESIFMLTLVSFLFIGKNILFHV